MMHRLFVAMNANVYGRVLLSALFAATSVRF